MDTKDKILNHIDKIEQYARQHPWLMEELQRRFGNSDAGFLNSDRERLKKIEQYLALDYDFQKVASVAGYDYVDIPQLKEKLVLDWREMLRYRYGIAARPISFVNFCSHAHFQAEGIVNYYHHKRYNGICDVDWFNTNIDEYVNTHNGFKLNHIPRTNVAGNPITLEDVNYNTKKCVLFNVMSKEGNLSKGKLTELAKTLNFIQKIRNNEAVHRSPTDNEPIDMSYSYEAVEYAVSGLNNTVQHIL